MQLISDAKHFELVPQFYFHVLDDLDTSDDEGAELADLGAARDHAMRAARVLMSESLVKDGKITLHHCIDIEDEAHAVLETVAFDDAVTVISSEGSPLN